ncbi:MAG: NADH-quinone oxidoreductase subunit M [Thermonemataceae bacterium]|nr:NADH-quinone oxidoreductase subunit M [Thermonemataceae bacterium]
MITALWLVLVPLFAALITFFIRNQAKLIALVASLIELGLGFYIFTKFEPLAKLQFESNMPWIPSAGINFHLAIDGLSIIPFLLTVFLVPFIILSTFNKSYEKPNVFYGLILLMQASLVGVFTAQSAFAYYLFWEGALIPVYFLAAIWGGEENIRPSFKFFIYTVFGSLLMLIALVYMYMQTPANHSDEASIFYKLGFDSQTQNVLFWALFIAFAIKMPIFPFHTWQPDTYTNSPAPATMLLSGIMLKMGIYSVFRWLMPVLPTAFFENAFLVIILAVIGIVYGAVIAIQQKDMKKILAYSSFSHVGLMAAGLFTFQQIALQGSMIQMFAHGVNVVGLFFVVEIIQQRTQSRDLTELSGLSKSAPMLTILFAILMLGSVGLPLTNGFVGEFMLLMGITKAYISTPSFAIGMGVFAGLTLILGAVYMLRMFQGAMFGEANPKTANVKDLNWVEALTLIPLATMVFVLGIFPNLLLKLSDSTIKDLLISVVQRIKL